MKLKAKDTFHTSGVGTVRAGQEFETHDQLGNELVAAGHAEIVEGSGDTTKDPAAAVPGEGNTRVGPDDEQPDEADDADEKAALPPLGKVEPAPKNKRGRPPAAAPATE